MPALTFCVGRRQVCTWGQQALGVMVMPPERRHRVQVKDKAEDRGQPAHTWISGFQPPELRENTLLLLKPPGCGWVMAILAKESKTK